MSGLKQSQKIAKNAAFGILGAGLGGILNILSLLIAARMLGLADFGHYSYLLAFATVFQYISDFGLSNILVREIARRPMDQELLLGSVKTLFWIIFVIGVVLMGVVISFVHLAPQLKLLSWMMGLGYLWLLHSAGYLSVLRANQEMEFNSMGFILHKVLLVGLIWLTLTCGLGLLGVVISHICANFLQWLFYHVIVLTRYSPGRFRYEPALWKSLLIESIPMGGGVALRQLTWQTDVFIVASLLTPTALGLFSGPFRLLVGVTLISVVLAVPFFPVFARLAQQAPQELEHLYQRVVKWFCLISFPIMAVCFSWSDKLVLLFLGEHFRAAIPAFHVLSLAVVPIFLSVLYPYIYCALDKQFDYFRAMGLTVLTRVAVGLLVIPHFGFVGACCSIAAIETALFGLLCWRLKMLGFALGFARNLARPALASALAAVVLGTAWNSGLVWSIGSAILSGMVFLAVVWWTRVLSPEELGHVKEGLGFLRPYLKGFALRAKGSD